MVEKSAKTGLPHDQDGVRYAVVLGPTGVHRIVRRDGRPLGSSPADTTAGSAGARLAALRWQQAIRAAHAPDVRTPTGPASRSIASNASPPPVAGGERAARALGWRRADRGAFARRLGVDGAALREARRRTGLSQRALARSLRVERSVVAAAETGDRNVGPALARWAAQVLGRRPRLRAAARSRIRPPLRLGVLADAHGRPLAPPPALVRRVRVLNRVRTGASTQAAAGAALGISVRQVRRLLAAAATGGPPALLHGLLGRPPANRLPAAVRELACELARTRYADCSVSRLTAILAERYGIAVGRETLRGWLRARPPTATMAGVTRGPAEPGLGSPVTPGDGGAR